MSVWDVLIGQAPVVEILAGAASAAAGVTATDARPAARASMTHSWLFTGPAGAGRSMAARAFAAALNCKNSPPGCGECNGCHTVLTDTAADLRTVRPEGLSLGVKDIRELVRDAASAPTSGRWRVLLLEDADRLTDQAANALLKALEEPATRSVFLLCAPSVDDVLPTVRSRCRVVALRLPTPAQVAGMLEHDGVDPAQARLAAQATMGDADRARALATDEATRLRRAEVLRLPTRLQRTGDCLAAAADLVAAANADAEAANTTRDDAETDALKTALGVGATSAGTTAKRARAPKPGAKARALTVRGATGALKELEKTQKSRGRRTVLDSLDRALLDLAGWYRDVLVRQLGAPVEAIHPDHGVAVAEEARTSTPEQTLRRLEAVLRCRRTLAANPGLVPLLTVEALTLDLRTG
ncbi:MULTISPECIES: DNA polymerase III subunit delta' [unclassified Frankia]|uniref:DNA polymerase III subunit delta' n=1 Tax=unclassified Frankia TaxID=2632575 RepID=UPI002AD54CEE|nr:MULTISPECIES: DNA polymerase III subunit delta' [unclassified Frankia]